MYCQNCGKEIQDGSKFCRYCGAKQAQGALEKHTEAGSNKKMIPVIAALAGLVILGGAGVFLISGTQNDGKEAETVQEVSSAEPAVEDAAAEQAVEAAAEESQTVEEAAAEEAVEQEEPSVPTARDLGMDVPADALIYNGHSYYLFDNDCKSWEEVVAYCHARGGYPAVIESAEENTVLFNYMHEMGYECTFFGYTDHETEGHWKWVDGKTSDFTDWGVNREGEAEPNSDTAQEDFCQLDTSMVTGTWNDCAFAWDTVSFICEWDAVN